MPTYVKKARGKRKSNKKNRRKRRYRHTKEVGIQKILEVEKSIWEKESKRVPVQKTWDHAIESKERFVLRKRKVYSLLREKREKI